MREHKFRAFKRQSVRHTFTLGSYEQIPEGWEYFKEFGFVDDDWGNPHLCIESAGYADYIDLETLCEWAGLKDHNGNEIYENDIVTDTMDGLYKGIVKIGKYKVNFDYETYEFYGCYVEGIGDHNRGECNDFLSFALVQGNVKIIGNIYENPEFLKGETL